MVSELEDQTVDSTGQDNSNWDRVIRDRYRNKCANCGGESNLSVKLVVPVQAGGRLVETNGTLLCRTCDMVKATYEASSTEVRRPVNFLVSRRLYDRLQASITGQTGFKSMGALIRHLIGMYVENMSRFEDLEQYQDSGSDVKVNIWIDIDLYNQFKECVNARNLTVTDAIKSLVQLYEAEVKPVAPRRNA